MTAMNMAKPKQSPEAVVEIFWLALNAATNPDGWAIGRLMDGQFSRGFLITGAGQAIDLRIRVSRVSKGFGDYHLMKPRQSPRGNASTICF
jgi:hypothetical protein